MVASSPRRPPERTSLGRRKSVGLDAFLFEEEFQGAAVNTGQFNSTVTTMTVAVANGLLTLNSGGSAASVAVARVQSYAHFPVYGQWPTFVQIPFSLAVVQNDKNVTELGLGFATTTTAPTGGVYIRFDADSSGNARVRLVTNFNGTETFKDVANDFQPAALTGYDLRIFIANNYVEFWIGDRYLGCVERPTASLLMGIANSYPILLRTYNSAIAATAQKLNVGQISVLVGDLGNSKPWPHQMARAGFDAIQGQTAGTMGQTANYANSAAPASASLSNTAAGYTTLGGQWQFVAVGGAETDYALFAWQNPAATETAPGMTLHCTGIDIDTMNTGAAVATTATWLQWAMAVGATAVSLATAEAAAAKAPRRFALGNQVFAIADAIGKQAVPISRQFAVPKVVHPGEFLHIICKMPLGTATASQVIRGVAAVHGYFE